MRIGAVDFLNTLPLIDGLEHLSDIELKRAVPSALIGELLADRVDIALCSLIDYQRSPEPLRIVPCGLLGCAGSTMTVRLFSQVPIGRITAVHCDTDSHTSVALLRVLLDEVHGLQPALVHFDARNRRVVETGEVLQWPETMLLIGDKVVSDSAPAVRYPYQADLGAEWFEHTGLPFVFAAWLAKPGNTAADEAGVILDRQRRHNNERRDGMMAAHAAHHGWPVDLARIYVHEMITYEWTEAAYLGAMRFFESACRLGVIDAVQPLEGVPWSDEVGCSS
ncbi:MAG: menaquinone biosynthesis protein [Planctomycetes bacterium]|nr:menaquinone biosynthesis protein [Planctomycetota bacterium]